MAEKIIDIRNVKKHFGGVRALKGFDFDIYRGEIHCLVGQNGCGKSTLIKIISGVTKCDEGSEIIINGKPMKNITAQTAMAEGISVIYQDLSLFPNMSVAENISFGLNTAKTVKPVDWKEIRRKAADTLKLMNVELDIDSSVSSLSIADRQLVAIARSLADEAELLIMDEPTSSLTRKEVNVLFSIIRNLQAKGLTVLFVSHKLDEIIEIAERITVVRDGEKIGTYDKKDIDTDKLTELITGQNIVYKQDFVAPSDETILKVEDLSCGKQYSGINFEVKKGEIVGIIGLLGSGRTELATTLFGMNPQDNGKIFIDGEEVKLRSNRDSIKHKIAYVPEDRLMQGLVIDQDVQSNISVSVIDRIKTKLGLVDLKQKRSLTDEWIDALNIKSAKADINASAMSGGNQQKIVISKWLATKPRILILDQPTNGIDIAAKSAIYDIIRQLAKDGMSIILISDENAEIYYNCRRAIVMHKGRIVKELDCSAITENQFYAEVADVR